MAGGAQEAGRTLHLKQTTGAQRYRGTNRRGRHGIHSRSTTFGARLTRWVRPRTWTARAGRFSRQRGNRGPRGVRRLHAFFLVPLDASGPRSLRYARRRTRQPMSSDRDHEVVDLKADYAALKREHARLSATGARLTRECALARGSAINLDCGPHTLQPIRTAVRREPERSWEHFSEQSPTVASLSKMNQAGD
jgi:hypothetical protein